MIILENSDIKCINKKIDPNTFNKSNINNKNKKDPSIPTGLKNIQIYKNKEL